MIDSRCGLHCTGCEYKETCGCGGCIETTDIRSMVNARLQCVVKTKALYIAANVPKSLRASNAVFM